ncbi:PREDICTED: splicing factor 3B subunit 2-like [Amphimedon queenslandica]|uniref:PSP proline-rich domain-containing protein n=1 Tax=Amphimedon queenslandica TaxID=400682 RepID=A0A1X7V9Q8_AMPQE|nr:PREDICTED: splicing factor 3B subunit 2-like [Amphimedon queenslandica]|eukprot:XP_011402894.1 PREDICTED: splicing factor 3B subunit 2-like [Amphimedon queenslandica]
MADTHVVAENGEGQVEDKIKETKNQKKKKRRKRRQIQKRIEAHRASNETTEDNADSAEPDVEIEYVPEPGIKPTDPNFYQFNKVFEAFKLSDSDQGDKGQSSSHSSSRGILGIKKGVLLGDDSDDEDTKKKSDEPQLSKKKLRRLSRMSVAQLKQLVERPDLVEMHDVSAHDPHLLIYLKSARNTVQVPRHWCFKRKYLQGKRGIEKPPFSLPEFIKATGIMEMRSALEDKEEAKSLKQRTRERVRPKLGKLTIDYQKLHDAFFKWQTKPKMTIHGDLYYEGKEFETRLRDRKPGDLSDDLRIALGMPIGTGKQKFPPPWLIAMQRYGPPPSYPNLKIAGLNAPIPEGCSFGYFVGGWGKPPVDEMGRPLYGDVFGMHREGPSIGEEEEIDPTLWGELESSSEEEEEEEEEDESDEEKKGADEIQPGMITPMEGLVTPSGLTSIPAGMETPEMIQLRKKKIEEAMEQGGDTPALYTVLPEKVSSVGGAMMGSSHVYDMAAGVPGNVTLRKSAGYTEGIEISLEPSELELDSSAMTQKYEQVKDKVLQKEDLSDMVAEHAARQKHKRKKAEVPAAAKSTKKLKEFKF